ncbi:MAG: hypothetical protein AAF560_22645 [Acidobacteriota bacterium]
MSDESKPAATASSDGSQSIESPAQSPGEHSLQEHTPREHTPQEHTPQEHTPQEHTPQEPDVSWLRTSDPKPQQPAGDPAAASPTDSSAPEAAARPDAPPLSIPPPLPPLLEPEALEPVDSNATPEASGTLTPPVAPLQGEANRVPTDEDSAWQDSAWQDSEAQRRREAWEVEQSQREAQEQARKANEERELARPADETRAEEPEAPTEPEASEPDIDYLARAQEASLRRQEKSEEEVKRDFNRIVKEVEHHIRNRYDLIGLVGYSGSGKTHFLRALSLLLKQTQGFEVAEWGKLRKSLVPGFTAMEAFYYPVSRGKRDKWVFVDAGGELYARLSINDWTLAQDSAGLLHSLHHCKALFLLINLQEGHFQIGSAGKHRWMSEDEKQRDEEIQTAQAELEFFDSFLLFLRALISTGGEVEKLAEQCAEKGLDKALRSYRDNAPKLDIPVQVLFTQADTYADSAFEISEAIPLSPQRTTVGVAPFVARHLPSLLTTMLEHSRKFRFDFVQSYIEKQIPNEDDETIPEWTDDRGNLQSCGALPALEFLIRNLPSQRFPDRLLQRLEIDTRTALKLDRLLSRRDWRDFEVSL